MPRVYHRKARKDYPEAGVSKGEMYYTWDLKTGPRSSKVFRQKTPPLPEQLTTSAYLQEAHPLEREILRCDNADDLENLISQVEDLQSQEQEKLDNMPEAFADGDAAQLIQERIDACEEALDTMRTVLDDAQDDEREGDDSPFDALESVSLT